METFSPSAMIRFGWETFKKRPWFFIGIYLIISLLSGGVRFQMGTDQVSEIGAFVWAAIIVAALVMTVIQILVKMGSTIFALKAHDNPDAVSFGDLWAPHPFWKYIGASILVGVIILVGFVLLIIPGIIWALRYMFVPYLVMDRKLKPSEALGESARITYGHKWQLFGFVLLMGLVNVLGFLCLIVGLLVSIPVTALACAHAYRTLSRMAPAVA